MKEVTTKNNSKHSFFQARGNSRNILKITNHVFVAQNFNVAQDFKNVAVQRFSSEVTPISFLKPESAAREINSWVSSRTGGKIENLITPGKFELKVYMN